MALGRRTRDWITHFIQHSSMFQVERSSLVSKGNNPISRSLLRYSNNLADRPNNSTSSRCNNPSLASTRSAREAKPHAAIIDHTGLLVFLVLWEIIGSLERGAQVSESWMPTELKQDEEQPSAAEAEPSSSKEA